jgi:hypothetical protein
MAPQGGRDRKDRGAVIVSTLIAALVGALLAVGGSFVLVRAQTNSTPAPVTEPLVQYDQR